MGDPCWNELSKELFHKNLAEKISKDICLLEEYAEKLKTTNNSDALKYVIEMDVTVRKLKDKYLVKYSVEDSERLGYDFRYFESSEGEFRACDDTFDENNLKHMFGKVKFLDSNQE